MPRNRRIVVAGGRYQRVKRLGGMLPDDAEREQLVRRLRRGLER